MSKARPPGLRWLSSHFPFHTKDGRKRKKAELHLLHSEGRVPGVTHLTFPSHPTVRKWPHLIARNAGFILGDHPHFKAGGSITATEGDNGYQDRENTKVLIP